MLSLQKSKNQLQYLVCLLDAQNMLLIYKHWGGTTLVTLSSKI